MPRPPLKAVAELAGVSEPTVSRVLNGKPGVAGATRDRVIAALAELGFTSTDTSSPARRGLVGVITPELTNPAFPELAHGVMRRLSRHGLVSTLGVAARELDAEERYIEEFRRIGAAGIVVVSGHHADTEYDQALYHDIVESGVPLVLVNGADIGLDVPYVWSDESLAAARAVAHLAALGHRRIGCVLGPQRYIARQRFEAGYRQAMAAADLDVDDEPVAEAPFTFEGGVVAGRQLIERGMTAILCSNDLMAVGVIAAARRQGLTVPGDVSVIGYDGTDFAVTADPPLTTLRQPFGDMGAMVGDALVSEIDGTRRFRDRYSFAPELVARSSTGPVVRTPV